MAKAGQYITVVLVCFVVAVAIASLVFNVLVFVRYLDDHNGNDQHHDGKPAKLPVDVQHEYLADLPRKEQPPVERLIEFDTPAQVKSVFSSAQRSTNFKQSVAFPAKSVLFNLASTHVNSSIYCPSYEVPKRTPAWMIAASILLNVIDESVDPCDDFYSFTCGKYMKQTEHYSTALQAQFDVNVAIARALDHVDVNDEKQWSLTERITKAALDSCLHSRGGSQEALLIDIANWFGAIPFLNQTLERQFDVFEAAGSLEQLRALGTLMSSWVSVDYKDPKRNVLYISQPSLPMPREYYVLPQFTPMLKQRTMMVEQMLTMFSLLVLDDPTPFLGFIKEAANDIVKLERDIAMASWPDSEMRDYAKQYNSYSVDELNRIYSNINWEEYLARLLSEDLEAEKIATKKVVLSQPSYFAWLNSLMATTELSGNKVKETIVNYMITQLIFEDAQFLVPQMAKLAVEANYIPYAQRRGRGVRRIGQQLSRRFDGGDYATFGCVETILNLMPYGPGYVYAKSLSNRDELAKDTKDQINLITSSFVDMTMSLDWMSMISKRKVRSKVNEMVINIGWPSKLFGDFTSTNVLDDYHKKEYGPVIQAYNKDPTDFYTIKHILQAGLVNREAVHLLPQPADRTNFLVSPAMVNAWYQPERNSLTIPSALWNPPFYSPIFPKAFNFAGLGSVAGHELMHGFDDEGIQFDKSGAIICSDWNVCGWMDRKSVKGFTDMAQCVVTQYSTQCCPEKTGYVRCANGATTQGENIADIGGVESTYNAYVAYMKNQSQPEKRLPGLEQFTPNQLFWMYYANTWCTSSFYSMITTQLLVDPHAPAQCRTNQVVQDIPAFGADFGCEMGQNMFPKPDTRCKVWTAS